MDTQASAGANLTGLEGPVEGIRFRRRAVAYVVDSILLIACNYLFGSVAGVVLALGLVVIGLMSGQRPLLLSKNLVLLNMAVGTLLFISYFALQEVSCGATIGKLLTRIRVVDLDGRPPSMASSVTRAGWRFIDGLFFGLVAWSTMETPMWQRYGDKHAKTVVVRSDALAITVRPPAYKFVAGFITYCFASGLLQGLAMLPLISFAPSR